jgi:hypothetical protein
MGNGHPYSIVDDKIISTSGHVLIQLSTNLHARPLSCSKVCRPKDVIYGWQVPRLLLASFAGALSGKGLVFFATVTRVFPDGYVDRCFFDR